MLPRLCTPLSQLLVNGISQRSATVGVNGIAKRKLRRRRVENGQLGDSYCSRTFCYFRSGAVGNWKYGVTL